MHFTYRPEGTCSTTISFDLEGDVVKNVQFQNGCHGNLQAVGRLVEGLSPEKLQRTLSGICCGHRGTSCADQLCRAVQLAWAEEQNGR